MHRKNLAKKNKHDADHTSALLSLIPLFLTIFCQKMRLEELLGNVNRTAEKRRMRTCFLHCRKGDKRRCTGGMYQSPVCDRPHKP